MHYYSNHPITMKLCKVVEYSPEKFSGILSLSLRAALRKKLYLLAWFIVIKDQTMLITLHIDGVIILPYFTIKTSKINKYIQKKFPLFIFFNNCEITEN